MAPSPSADSLAVTSLGLVSSLGHDVVASCAAARAGIIAPTELTSLAVGTDELFGPEGFDGPPMIFGHTVPGIGAGFSGIGKALELGAVAIADLLTRRPLTEREQNRTGFYVAVSDHFIHDRAADLDAKDVGDGPSADQPSARWRRQSAPLADRLLERAELGRIPERGVRHGGHAGFATCLSDAAAQMKRGVIDRAIVGGVESRVEPAFLRAAAALRALKTKDNPVGLMPGEAASFILLERPRDAEQQGLRALLELRAFATASDSAHHFGDAPTNGAVLADVIRKVLAADEDLMSKLGLFISDINGTERRAIEWGHALTRIRSSIGRDRVIPLWLPAASFGDTGAATGAVAVCMAARALERGYAPSRGAIVWLSSESGAKGAFGLVLA